MTGLITSLFFYSYVFMQSVRKSDAECVVLFFVAAGWLDPVEPTQTLPDGRPESWTAGVDCVGVFVS